jgi:hypothetical protein
MNVFHERQRGVASLQSLRRAHEAASASAPVTTSAHAAHHFGLLAPRPLVAAAKLLKPPGVLALPAPPAELVHVERGQGRRRERRWTLTKLDLILGVRAGLARSALTGIIEDYRGG